jgi:hypothetical protein
VSTTTANQGIPLPEPSDADNVPYAIAQAVGGIEPRLVMRFTSATQRDAKITSPVAGMIASCGTDGLFHYVGGSSPAWVRLDDYALPDPVTASGSTQTANSAAAWNVLPSSVAASLVLPAPALVLVEFGAWGTVGGSGATDLRLFPELSGATSLSAPGLAFGQVPIIGATAGATFGTAHLRGSYVQEFASGTTTATLKTYATGTPTTRALNYAALRLTPLRWVA